MLASGDVLVGKVAPEQLQPDYARKCDRIYIELQG